MPIIPAPLCADASPTNTNQHFVAGWTAGLGIEYMLWGNVFMRGEWEYVQIHCR